jgi:hypothetical protein
VSDMSDNLLHLDPAKPLYENDRVVAVHLKNGMQLEFTEGSFRELRNRENGAEVFTADLLYHDLDSEGEISVCGPSQLIELVYYNTASTEE